MAAIHFILFHSVCACVDVLMQWYNVSVRWEMAHIPNKTPNACYKTRRTGKTETIFVSKLIERKKIYSRQHCFELSQMGKFVQQLATEKFNKIDWIVPKIVWIYSLFS